MGATTLRVRPTPERPLSPCVIKTVSQRPEAIAAAAWRTWIMNEQPPTAVPSALLGVRRDYARPSPPFASHIKNQSLTLTREADSPATVRAASQWIGTHDRVKPSRSSAPTAARLPKSVIRGFFAAIVAVSTTLLSGCGEDGVISRFMLKPERIIIERRPDPAYDQLFPYYVELCATSQFRSKLKGEGGVAGHAVMYIKGACKDEQAPYPLLRRCRVAATELDDPEHGAGVSVGRWFRNVNWVAIPGYHLFYEGNLKIGEHLTEAHFNATVRDAIDKNIYKGVEFHDYASAGAGLGLKNFVVNEAIGTDFALQFARSLFCARLPVTESMLGEVIAFLNDKNREYAEGEGDYNWSVWADNCAHTLRNALAAANIWSPLSVRVVKFRQLFNLAVPANEFVNLAQLGTEGNIDDYREIQQDGPQRDALHEFHWLPARHGALLKTLPVHEPNDLYDTTFRLFTLQSPFRMGKTKHAIDLLSDDRFVNLGANLHYFRDKYEMILARHSERREMLASVRGTPYRRVERLFYDYIEAQRAEVGSLLDRFAALEGQPDAAQGQIGSVIK